jgi:outer membrane receptor protein involved in Fe transport
VKDKLWFFGAYNRVSQRDDTTIIQTLTAPGAPALGSVVSGTINRNLYAGKLTYKLDAQNTLTASLFGDPSSREGPVFFDIQGAPVINGPPSTFSGTLNTGGLDFVARYDGTFGNSFLVQAQYGRHRENTTYSGAGTTQYQILDQTVNPNVRTGGFGGFQPEQFTRSVGTITLDKFVQKHEFRIGGDIEDVPSSVQRFYSGGSFTYVLPGGLYRHRYFVNDLAPGFNRTDPTTWQVAYPLTSQPKDKNYSAFAQDQWRVGHGLTLNLGIRWERQTVIGRSGTSSIDLKKNFAPRAGFVWDVSQNGKSKIYGNFGRFFENIPLDINIRSFGGELLCFCYNFDANPADLIPDPASPRKSTILGNSVEPTDPNLKGQYIDEYLVGFEYEVAPNLVLGVKGAYRKLGRAIEDFLVPAQGTYFVANPGEGTLGQSLAFYGGQPAAPAPSAQRKNTSLEIDARKRFSNNWQFLASYVYSKLEGNYDGTFQNSTGQLDPNINSAFDYADFLVNTQGPLSNDRRNQLKFDGSYEFSSGALKGLNLGLSTHWFSGVPLNAYGYSFAYANWEYYLAQRGSVGRGPSVYEADVHLSYPIKLNKNVKLNVVVNAFNILNRQSATNLDQRYNLVSDGPCAGLPAGLCNGDGGWLTAPGTLTPVGTLTNPRLTATNPNYLTKSRSPYDFTLPRSVQLGVRLTF